MHKRLTDPTFRYIPSHETNIAATFRRIIAEQKKAEAKPATVTQIKRKAGAK